MPDFNRNGFNDILWRNYETGDNVIWSMGGANGTTVLSGLPLPNVPQPEYRLELAADFNGDTHADFLWRNYETGENLVWLMNENNIIGGALLPPLADTAWQPGVAGDFTGDGQTDLVWRNTITGENVIWAMNGTTVTGGIALPQLSSEWHLSPGGDVDRNGTPDLFWRNTITGDNVIWRMQGSTVLGGVALLPVPEPEWRMEGADDFDRNGFADFQWRNYQTGENLIWLMAGANIIGVEVLPPLDADSGWESPSGSVDNITVGTPEADFFSLTDGADLAFAGAGNDTLQGEAGNDRLRGEAEDDFLMGNLGSDALMGGAGNDTLQGYTDSSDLLSDRDTLTGGVGSDTFKLRVSSVETISFSIPSSPPALPPDIITDFEDGVDRLVLPTNIRFSYFNSFIGYGSYLKFSPFGDQGEHTLISQSMSARFVMTNYNLAVLKNVTPSQLSAADFIGSDLTITGTPENNSITSSESFTSLWGDLGNDTISGLAGDDLAIGSMGEDHLYGNKGNDTLIGGGNGYLGVFHVSGNTNGLDGGNNRLLGDSGDDVLIAGDYSTNNLSLPSNVQPDILTGGEGSDTFAINKYTSFDDGAIDPNNVLQITDFQNGVDVLSWTGEVAELEFQPTGLNGENTLIFTRSTTDTTWGIAVLEGVSSNLITETDFVPFPDL
jgi:Ca2+-binding RTX toxin-like protein